MPCAWRLFLLAGATISALYPLCADAQCPDVCDCSGTVEWDNITLTVTNCSGQALLWTPMGLPNDTQYLDLRGNLLRRVQLDSIANLSALVVLDTRDNPRLWDLPCAASLLGVDTLYTDKGSTCCIYEMNWRSQEALAKYGLFLVSLLGWDSEAYKLARDSCVASEPYEECRDDLINEMSLALYTVTLVLSLILNPWVILVNLVIPKRRRDPYILVLVHFSITNILLTFYAAMFTGYGFTYLNKYQYHMATWQDNPACTIMGVVLVTSSLQLSFLCMMIVIHFYLNVKHPLENRRQFTAKRLHLAVLVTWGMALAIAALPFVTGQNDYNNVASCLPFQSGGKDTLDWFAMVYTMFESMSLVVIVTLTGIVVNSLMKQNKRIENQDTTNSTEKRIMQENRSVRKAILIKVAGFIIFNIVLDALLIMSCIDINEIAILGREWFARLCVMQAVFWPLIGSFKHKRFFRDTKRVFQLWNCWDYDKNRIMLKRRTTSHRRTSDETSQ